MHCSTHSSEHVLCGCPDPARPGTAHARPARPELHTEEEIFSNCALLDDELQRVAREPLNVEGMLPRERAVIEALGEADPAMLPLSEIADRAGGHLAGYATTTSSLRGRRFLATVTARGPGDRQPLYRLLPRGQRAYRQLLDQQLEQAQRREASTRALSTVGWGAAA